MWKVWLGPVPLVVLLRARHVKVSSEYIAIPMEKCCQMVLESNSLITKPWFYDIISEWLGRGLLTRLSGRPMIPSSHLIVSSPHHVKLYDNKKMTVPREKQHESVFSTSDKWYSRRKIITPTFHFNILKGYRDVFVTQGRVCLLIFLTGAKDCR